MFYLGALIALISLSLSFIVPHDPGPGNETIFKEKRAAALAQPTE